MCGRNDDPTTYETEARTVTMTWAEMRGDDVLNSRDIIERIAELSEQDDRDEYEEAELATLSAFAEEASGYMPDWQYGEGLVLDSYFEDYARELAEDIGAIDPNASWPLTYIDWTAAADALKQDYTSIEVDGLIYWGR